VRFNPKTIGAAKRLLAFGLLLLFGCAPSEKTEVRVELESLHACQTILEDGVPSIADTRDMRFLGKVTAAMAKCRGGENAAKFRATPWTDWANYRATGDTSSRAPDFVKQAPEHPLRRLLHFACQTALIGNLELAHFQIAGPDGFATRLFSHDYPVLVQIINRHLASFRLADLDPEHDLERRGVSRTPFAYPQRDNVFALWQVTRDFVARYLDLYYPDDRAVASDVALQGWRRELDRLLPAGLADGDGWIGSAPLDRVSLKRIAATFCTPAR
jgi:hypothetical protein